jgi:NADH-quinone oxidoreductase subunit J
MEGLFFYIFGTLATIGALATITRRDPVTSAFWLIFCFLNVAALFAVLQAHLLAVLQILIYAGAIMVFFIFVTMFLGQTKRRAAGPNRFLLGAGIVSVVAMGIGIGRVVTSDTAQFGPVADDYGSIEGVSELLLGHYIFPFELTGLLLTVAVIGAVMLARREAPGSRGARDLAATDAIGEGGTTDA